MVRLNGGGKEMMNMDENAFFREATLRICSSLDIETALKRCFEYIGAFIPMIRTTLHTLDYDLNLMQLVASAGVNQLEGYERVVPLPEKGRNKRAADLQAALSKNEVMIVIVNQPDQEEGLSEIIERLGVKSDVSVMMMFLKLESNLIGMFAVAADGLNQYNKEHARLLQLLHEPFSIAMFNALEHQEIIRLKDMLADDNRYLFEELRSASGDEIIGSDFGLKAVMRMVQQVAPLDSPVLLLGETGTGKELIANAIHSSSPRKEGPFIKVNCGAIPETLLDSELFGHEKGAFTGAIGQKRGRFERADKGTIFLDEIGELPPQAQVRLLHVLQRKVIERVGGTRSIPVDIRIISATHRNLQEMVGSGQFREDLWYRLNVFPIMIPPLRQRKGDIPALVHHFIYGKSIELKLKEKPKLALNAIDRLTAYDWPGNVRELENTIERALIQHRAGAPLSFEALLLRAAPGKVIHGQSRDEPLVSLDEMNAQYIRRALDKAGGKIYGPGGAAQILNINPSTLRKRMNKLGIRYGRKSWRPD
jgi:transcriptional regulator with GAF, ATPase, and Fis domain